MILNWLLALHIIAMVCWFAGLFYLPRLFVYHSMSEDSISQERFKIMERKLYYGIMTPSAILTLISGLWIMHYQFFTYLNLGWMQAKLALVALLVIFHCYCGVLLYKLRNNTNTHTHHFYRWLNELPTLVLIGIVILVKVKP